MLEYLEQQKKLTINQWKIFAAATIGDMLDFFDFLLIAFVLAFIVKDWNLTYGESGAILLAAKHQSLLHFVGNAPWSDAAMLARVGQLVLPAIERSGPIEAWIIDDTGFPKKGRHSVGVTRQYCGQLGKQDNCQVAVTLSLANHDASLPVAYQLYL